MYHHGKIYKKICYDKNTHQNFKNFKLKSLSIAINLPAAELSNALKIEIMIIGIIYKLIILYNLTIF